MNRSTPHGPFGLLSLKAQAWMTERMTDAQVRIYQAHSRLLDAEASVIETEYSARTRALLAHRQFEAERTGTTQARHDYEALLPLTRSILERQDGIERRLEAHELRLNELPRLLPPPPQPVVTLDVDISDRQIEAIAARAVNRISALAGPKQEAAWAAFQAEARQRFPAYAAEEIIRRADQLRRIVR